MSIQISKKFNFTLVNLVQLALFRPIEFKDVVTEQKHLLFPALTGLIPYSYALFLVQIRPKKVYFCPRAFICCSFSQPLGQLFEN